MNTKRLESLRKILDAKRREVLEEIGAELGENIDENSRFQVGNISDILDKAKVSLDLELNYQVLHQKNERLKLIEESLMRLEDGNYGICSDCGEPIDENRLAVMPFAIYCVDCQKLHEIGQETPNL
jgi:DnaK suppressor protein